MPDPSRFAALAVKIGAVPPVPPNSLGGGTHNRAEINQQNQRHFIRVPPVPPVPPRNSVGVNENDLIDAFEERAAILEYDGGLPRGEAETLAWAEIFGSRERVA